MRGMDLRATQGVFLRLMTLYTIVLNEPSDHAWAKIRATWPKGHHILDDRVAFISADGALTGDIAKQIGIDSEQQINGIVVQMDYFSGRTDASLVEWISKSRG